MYPGGRETRVGTGRKAGVLLGPPVLSSVHDPSKMVLVEDEGTQGCSHTGVADPVMRMRMNNVSWKAMLCGENDPPSLHGCLL